jgi:predicted O-methyltransferase YrrM
MELTLGIVWDHFMRLPKLHRLLRRQTVEEAPDPGSRILMLAPEREFLSAFIYSVAPKRVLEIGTHQGGSAAVIVTSMNRLNSGVLTCIDPDPLIAKDLWQFLCRRTTLIKDRSPGAIPLVSEEGDKFDIIFIDGDHTFDGVCADIDGALPVLRSGGYILFHDAHFPDVERAINKKLAQSSNLIDCGLVSTGYTTDEAGNRWGGLRLLRSK